jgi:hypothetical protein
MNRQKEKQTKRLTSKPNEQTERKTKEKRQALKQNEQTERKKRKNTNK